MAHSVVDKASAGAPIHSAEVSLRPVCAVPGCACHDRRGRMTVPNAVTLARTLASLALVTAAAHSHSAPLLIAAYLTYWIGDVADGACARRLDQQTRLGAALDIACDRLNCISCALTLLMFIPAKAAVAVFLVQFGVVDLLLSLLPLRWPVLSPNYFYLVDPVVFRFNWSPVAKATNTALFVTLLVLVPDHRVALAAAAGVLGVKLASLVRLICLPAPGGGHATSMRTRVDPATRRA